MYLWLYLCTQLSVKTLLQQKKKDWTCKDSDSSEKYRAFHNVLRDYKNLLQENRRSRIYETCTDRRNNSNFFPSKLLFIVVYISAARRCECM